MLFGHIDVETYSELDLKEVGLYRYARHHTTDVLCLTFRYKYPGKPGLYARWMRDGGMPGELVQWLNNGFMLKAHNCAFDAEIWRWVLAGKYGWYWPGYDRWYDSMAQAQVTNLPGKLELAAKFFGGHEKDLAGHKLMLKLCKPAPLTKNLRDHKRYHTPENLLRLSEYCDADVRAEAGFSRIVPMLSPFEEKAWRATWRMNRRGVYVDVDRVEKCRRIAHEVQDKYRTQLCELTGGDVEKETQRPSLGRFLEEHGAVLPRTEKGNLSFSKDSRDDIIMDDADETAHRALELYDRLNKSSLSKLDKMLACRCDDGLLRGMFAFSGAGQTRRWAGREVQLQNLPRGIFELEHEYLEAIGLLDEGFCADDFEVVYGDAFDVLASLIRTCLVARPGHRMVCADYSAIEGRVLAWLAGEDHILDAYRAGKRLYAVAASAIYGCSYETVVAEKKAGNKEKDAVGKVSELACGFGGSVGAFMKMGGARLGLTVERIKEIVDAWRANRRKTVVFWYNLERAAMEAMRRPGRRIDCGPVAFGYNGQHLRCKLPSGGKLWYRKARIGEKVWPDGGTSPQIEYYGVENNKVGWQSTYGGKLAENVTQATARDILAHAMIKCDEVGWPLTMTVHDELVADEPIGGRDHNDLCAIMCQTPDWARGCPISAAGWTGDFYRK